MSDSGVDLGEDAGFNHLTHIDTQRCAPEIQRWDGQDLVLTKGYLIHFEGGAQRYLWGSANKLGNGRCSRHSHAPIAGKPRIEDTLPVWARDNRGLFPKVP